MLWFDDLTRAWWEGTYFCCGTCPKQRNLAKTIQQSSDQNCLIQRLHLHFPYVQNQTSPMAYFIACVYPKQMGLFKSTKLIWGMLRSLSYFCDRHCDCIHVGILVVSHNKYVQGLSDSLKPSRSSSDNSQENSYVNWDSGSSKSCLLEPTHSQHRTHKSQNLLTFTVIQYIRAFCRWQRWWNVNSDHWKSQIDAAPAVWSPFKIYWTYSNLS